MSDHKSTQHQPASDSCVIVWLNGGMTSSPVEIRVEMESLSGHHLQRVSQLLSSLKNPTPEFTKSLGSPCFDGYSYEVHVGSKDDNRETMPLVFERKNRSKLPDIIKELVAILDNYSAVAQSDQTASRQNLHRSSYPNNKL